MGDRVACWSGLPGHKQEMDLGGLCSLEDVGSFLGASGRFDCLFRTLDEAEGAALRLRGPLSAEGLSPCVLRVECRDGRAFAAIPADAVGRLAGHFSLSIHEYPPPGPRYLVLDIDVSRDGVPDACSAAFDNLAANLAEHTRVLMEGVAAWMGDFQDPEAAVASHLAGVVSGGVRRKGNSKISVHVTTTHVVADVATAKVAAGALQSFLLSWLDPAAPARLLAEHIDMTMYTNRHSFRIARTPKVEYDDTHRGRPVPGSVHTYFSDEQNYFDRALVTGPWLAPVAFSRRSLLDHEQRQ